MRQTREYSGYRGEVLILLGAGLLLLIGVRVSADERDAGPAPNFDWLVGEWTMGEGARRVHMIWTQSPNGVKGVLERVEENGTRSLVTTYEITTDGGAVTLRLERLQAASIADLIGGEERTRWRGSGPRDTWGKLTPLGPPRPSAPSRFFTFKGGFVDGQYIAFRATGKDQDYMARNCPVALEFRLVRGRLSAGENHRRWKFKNWQYFDFDRLSQ